MSCVGLCLIVVAAPIAFPAIQTPVGQVMIIWIRAFLVSYISFCLLLFFQTPSTSQSSLSSSETVTETRSGSVVMETSDKKIISGKDVKPTVPTETSISHNSSPNDIEPHEESTKPT